MESERVYGSTDLLESFWISNPSPSNLHGDSYSSSTSMGTSEDIKLKNQMMKTLAQVEKEENANDDCEDYFYQPEKKRRLTSDQVHCLERSFEVENKLEPERKVKLAKELGLQPRQVAIWFQNRRARYKTKQLEKDFGGLKASYDRLKDDYDSLLKEKERLKDEVQVLKEKLIQKEKDNNPNEVEFQNQIPISDSEKSSIRDTLLLCKQEYASSTNSDVLDSDQSDGEDLLLAKSLFPTQLFFPKLEDACFDDPSEQGYNGNWTFSTNCQGSWLWP